MERTVTLWYLHRQLLLNELAVVEAGLVQGGPVSGDEAGPSEVANGVSLAELEERYKSIQGKLRSLGPCPRPMMG